MTEEKIVMYDSDEAAQFKTNISGWVSRDGHFFGTNERTARYSGCTHRKCETCGKLITKSYIICNDCYIISKKKQYDSLPKEVWNEEGGVYSEACDKYFWSWEEVDDYCEDEEIKESDLRLVICEPQYPRQIDDDYFCDELSEDGELPDKIVKAMEAFNKVLKESLPLSWYPSKKAVIRKKVEEK
jgi:hypothetical protein